MTQRSPNSVRLHNLLWKLNLINTEAAQVCGVSERTIYRWLSDKTKVPQSVLNLLEVTLSLQDAKGRK
jgi:hypothetical protein